MTEVLASTAEAAAGVTLPPAKENAANPPTVIPDPLRNPRLLTFFDPTFPNKEDFREPFAISLVFLFNIFSLQVFFLHYALGLFFDD
jgi:hypothetical protein